jgi:hypothetical protein
VDDLPSGQVHDDEAVEDLEAQGDDGEEITRPGLMEMVAKKRGPALAAVARQVRWPVLGDGSGRYLVAELSKLCGDLVLTPEWIFDPEPANQGPQVSIGWRTTNSPSGLFPPEETPRGTVPTDDGFRPHDSDRLEHRGEDSSGEREDDAISGTKAGLWHGTTQDDELLAKDDILREEGGAGLEYRAQCARHGLEDFDKHRGRMPTTSQAPEKSRKNSGRCDLVPSFCGAQAEVQQSTKPFATNDGSIFGCGQRFTVTHSARPSELIQFDGDGPLF